MRTLLVALTMCLGCTHMASPMSMNIGSVAAEQPVVTSPHILFDSPVDPISVTLFLAELEAHEQAGQNVIVVELDTPGGSVGAGMAMAKAMERSPAVIVCVVDGMAASMGLYLLQSCDVRTMTKRSLLMGHEPSSGMAGQPSELESLADLLRRLSRAMAYHIVAKTRLSLEDYLSRISNGREWWMNVEEAVDFAFVDFSVDSVSDIIRQVELLPPAAKPH